MGQFTPVIPDEPSFRYLQQMAERDRQGSRRNAEKLARHQATVGQVEPVQIWKSGSSTGDVLQSVTGVFPGRIRSLTSNSWRSGFNVWIRFIDWEADTGTGMYAANARYYLGRKGTMFRSPSTTGNLYPLYLCTSASQTFLAQTSSDVAKGATGTFKLYHSSESDSGFTVSAKAKGAAITANKWCTVMRTETGNWYAGCWET